MIRNSNLDPPEIPDSSLPSHQLLLSRNLLLALISSHIPSGQQKEMLIDTVRRSFRYTSYYNLNLEHFDKYAGEIQQVASNIALVTLLALRHIVIPLLLWFSTG